MTSRYNILIVDDMARARQSMKALLATWPGLSSALEAENGREAVLLIERQAPDLVLMDVRMPEMNGLEATRIIKSRWPEVKVIVVSMYSEYTEDALAAGADAVIGKGEPPDRLLGALEKIAKSQDRDEVDDD